MAEEEAAADIGQGECRGHWRKERRGENLEGFNGVSTMQHPPPLTYPRDDITFLGHSFGSWTNFADFSFKI